MSITLESKYPRAPLADKWDNFKANEKSASRTSASSRSS